MSTVYIDGIAYEAAAGRNMLEVVLDNKLDLQYFCWHPAMGSIGACRICAVRVFKDEKDTVGKIDMACMTPAREGTRISVNDPEAREFRKRVIEWLMVNHPHDCPVCDEGGECHLQDMTAMSGHVYRRYDGKKRTYTNQDLGPLVDHEMNRCIQCYRCVRFYRDHAGGKDLNVFASKNRVYFGRAEDGALESEFSGNLVEVCPTGVFTDKTYGDHYARKWDLETAPSVCPHCSLGCNTIPGARFGRLRRIRSRYNGDVNAYFLCDRGRYGYEFVNDRRPQGSCVGRGEARTQVTAGEALAAIRYAVSNAKGIVGIGSPRASIEANYALRTLVGDGDFSTGMSRDENDCAALALRLLSGGPMRSPSLAEVGRSDAVLILGADPTNEAPMLDYFIRQAMQRAPIGLARELKIPDWDAQAVRVALDGAVGKLYSATPWRIKLEELAAESLHCGPDEIERLADRIREPGDGDDLASRAARDLRGAERPLIVTSAAAGPGVIRAAAALADALCDSGKPCGLSVILPEANSMGQAMLGGLSVDEALERVADGMADTLIVLENDLYRRAPRTLVETAMERAANVIVLDCIPTETVEAADIFLATRAWVEGDGTFVNNEGRAQRFFQVFVPSGDSLSSWAVLRDVAGKAEWRTYEDALRDLARSDPLLAGALDAAPSAEWRSSANRKIARQTHRATGRTAKDADWTVFEPITPDDRDTPFAFTMEGDQGVVPGPLVPRFWAPGWNSENSVTKFQMEVDGPLYGGNSGRRLLEPGAGPVPDAPAPQSIPGEGAVLVIPRPAIFGSEELSGRSRGIEQMTPAPSVAMNPKTARGLRLAEGATARIVTDGATFELPVSLDDSLPDGIATAPFGYPQTLGLVRPCRAEIGPAG